MSEVTIEIKNLKKNYNNSEAVKNINFNINKGSIVGLLGPNGCGKTTTIGMILGLIKPTSGSVFINGQNIENENERTKILEKVNFISPYVELPKKLTVEENLKVYGKMYGVNNLKDKISDLMKQLNLLEFQKRKTGELSSGQKNRTNLLEKMNFISPYVELPKKLTVEENLKVYGKMYGVNNLKEKISNLMEKLNLNEFKKRKTGELSSGQKNRVSLAKALINDPEILLLDEPTASLDPDVGDYIRGYIENFASKKGTTILLASHNMNEVERLCNEVMMMKNGIIIDKGTSKDLINKHGRKNLEETFLKIVRE